LAPGGKSQRFSGFAFVHPDPDQVTDRILKVGPAMQQPGVVENDHLTVGHQELGARRMGFGGVAEQRVVEAVLLGREIGAEVEAALDAVVTETYRRLFAEDFAGDKALAGEECVRHPKGIVGSPQEPNAIGAPRGLREVPQEARSVDNDRLTAAAARLPDHVKRVVALRMAREGRVGVKRCLAQTFGKGRLVSGGDRPAVHRPHDALVGAVIDRFADRRSQCQDQRVSNGVSIHGGDAFESKPFDEDGAWVGGDDATDRFGQFKELRRGVLNHVGQSRLSACPPGLSSGRHGPRPATAVSRGPCQAWTNSTNLLDGLKPIVVKMGNRFIAVHPPLRARRRPAVTK
jgi:hypothetical protein